MKSFQLIDRALVGMAIAVITTTLAAVGLTTAAELQRLQHRPSTDTAMQRSSAESQDGLSLPTAPIDEPELMRLDRANDHHG